MSRTVYKDVEVEIDLDDFDDDDIRQEYNDRNLAGAAENWDEKVELEKAYMYHHNGQRELAYDILWRMCLIRLNKVV